MFKYLLKGLRAGIAVQLLDNYRRLSVQLLRIEAAKCYLHGVRVARLSAIGLARLGLTVGLIGVGALLVHLGLFILLPLSIKTKALLGVLLGLGYVTTGCVVLRAALREKAWLEDSGAVDVLAAATGKPTCD